jgi:hypothetical protein
MELFFNHEDSVKKTGTEFFLEEINASLIWPYKKRTNENNCQHNSRLPGV